MTIPDALIERVEKAIEEFIYGLDHRFCTEDDDIHFLARAAIESLSITEGEVEQRAMELRPEVIAFALLMERELRANDHKPGWKSDDPNALADRVLEEARELADITAMLGLGKSYDWNLADTAAEPKYWRRLAEVTERLGSEAADVANMAMMVADVCGALPTISLPSTVRGEGK